MQIVAVVFALLAAVVHAYIFVLESLTWTTPRTRAVFGVGAEQAEQTKELAFNQGFYNLFLGVVAAVGAIVLGTGDEGIGAALVYAGCGAMVAAATVLGISSPDKARAAVTQGVMPLIAVVTLSIALAS